MNQKKSLAQPAQAQYQIRLARTDTKTIDSIEKLPPGIELLDGNLSQRYTNRILTGFEILDSAINDKYPGLCWGTSMLIYAEGGLGKTTLAIQILWNLVQSGQRVLINSNEQGVDALNEIFGRVSSVNGVKQDNYACSGFSGAESIISKADEFSADVLVQDSIQMLGDHHGAVDRASHKLIEWAEQNDKLYIGIGRCRKDGKFEGRMSLKHVHDVVWNCKLVKNSEWRELRIEKSRIGPAGSSIDYEVLSDGISFGERETDSGFDAAELRRWAKLNGVTARTIAEKCEVSEALVRQWWNVKHATAPQPQHIESLAEMGFNRPPQTPPPQIAKQRFDMPSLSDFHAGKLLPVINEIKKPSKYPGFKRVGKKKAGVLLDGIEYHDSPMSPANLKGGA